MSARFAGEGCCSAWSWSRIVRVARPFPRADRVTEGVLRAGRAEGVLLYPSTGLADGTNGDAIVLGPPFVTTDDELTAIVDRLAIAIDVALAAGVA